MPYRCVRCASELPEPLPDRCPRCGLDVSRSLPAAPLGGKQDASASGKHQVLVDADSSAEEDNDVQRADFVPLSSPTSDLSAPFDAEQRKTRRSLWLPVGIAVVLSSLLIGALVRVPIGSAISHWGAAAAPRPATPTTTPKLYEFHDTLRQGNVRGWPVVQGRCFFAKDGYHVKDGSVCDAPVLAIENGEIDVTVKILADPCASTEEDACVGVWFRAQGPNNTYAMTLGQDGTWWMGKTIDGQTETMFSQQQHAAIHPGLNILNTVEILMRGDYFTVYVNKIQVGGAVDATFTDGNTAFVAVPGAEAVFSDLSVIAAP